MTTDFNPRFNLRPAARPVDTYAEPLRALSEQLSKMPKPKSSLEELGEALKPLSTNVADRLSQRHQDQQEVGEEAGRQAYIDHRLEFNQAVKAGKIDPAVNPYFTSGYMEQQGAAAAEQAYGPFLQGEWLNAGLTDKEYENEFKASAAYQSFLRDRSQQFINKHRDADGGLNPAWLVGFERYRSTVEQSVTQLHTAERLKVRNEKMDRTIADRVSNILLQSDDIPTLLDDYFKTELTEFGINGRRFNDIVIQQFTREIEALTKSKRFNEAKQLLALIDQVPAGEGAFLGGTAAGKEFKLKLSQTIERREIAAEELDFSRKTRDWRLEDRDIQRRMLQLQEESIPHIRAERLRAERGRYKEDAREYMAAEMLHAILSDPGADFEPQFIELAGNPTYTPLVPTLRAALDQRRKANLKVNMTPEMVARAGRLQLALSQGQATAEDIMEGVERRVFDQSTMATLLSTWVRSEYRRGELNKREFEVRTAVKDGEAYISRILGSKDEMGREVNPTRTVQAIMYYQSAMAEFLATAPEGRERSLFEVHEFRNKIIKQLNSEPTYQPQHNINTDSQRPPLIVPGARAPSTASTPDWAQ